MVCLQDKGWLSWGIANTPAPDLLACCVSGREREKGGSLEEKPGKQPQVVTNRGDKRLVSQGCPSPEWPSLAAPGGPHVSADSPAARHLLPGVGGHLTRGPPSRPLQPDVFSFSCPEL